MGKAFELITQIAGADVTISKKDAFVALGGMVPKLSDSKLKGPASDALLALAEVVGPQFICAQLHKQASAQKNPKVLVLNIELLCSQAMNVWVNQPVVETQCTWIHAFQCCRCSTKL